MATTLYIELNRTHLRLMMVIKDEQTMEEMIYFPDITGGYGKTTIPLCLRYLSGENTKLIGEDALLYDYEEDGHFVANVMMEETMHFVDYLTVLIQKVENAYNVELTKIMLIEQGEDLLDNKHQLVSIRDIHIHWVTFYEAMIGFVMKEQYQNPGKNVKDHSRIDTLQAHSIVVYLNEAYAYCININTDRLNEVRYQIISFPLIEINQFYIDLLQSIHKEIEATSLQLLSEEEIEYKIIQLFESQKFALFHQIQTKKDVNIYSSVFYPPKKCHISYVLLAEFMRQWEREYTMTFSKTMNLLKEDGLVYFSGGSIYLGFLKEIFGKKIRDFSIKEFMLFEGTHYLLEHDITIAEPKVTQKKMLMNYYLYNNKSKILLIKKEDLFQKQWDFELIFDELVSELLLFQSEETLEEDNVNNKKIAAIDIMTDNEVTFLRLQMRFNEKGQFKEVKYEHRRV